MAASCGIGAFRPSRGPLAASPLPGSYDHFGLRCRSSGPNRCQARLIVTSLLPNFSAASWTISSIRIFFLAFRAAASCEPIQRAIARSSVHVICEGEPWRESRMGREPKEWPKCAPRYAAASTSRSKRERLRSRGAVSAMEARAPGRRWPVKTASRRSRARAARALTGLRRVRDVLAGRGGGAPDQDGKIKAPSGRAYVVGRSERVYLVIREIRARPVVAPLPRAIRTASTADRCVDGRRGDRSGLRVRLYTAHPAFARAVRAATSLLSSSENP
jgi:hypothetical protein